jgi:hypothetical protein
MSDNSMEFTILEVSNNKFILKRPNSVQFQVIPLTFINNRLILDRLMQCAHIFSPTI